MTDEATTPEATAPAPEAPPAAKTPPKPAPVPVPPVPSAIEDYPAPRDDNDARVGKFARVVSGPFDGKYGVYVRALTFGADGYPDLVLLRTRDERGDMLQVSYADLRPAAAGGR